MENEINYRYLRKIQQNEKNSPKLSALDFDFYQSVINYIKDLEKRYKNDNSEQKQKILNEEIINTKKIIENIYEMREKKIINAALSKARGGEPDTKQLLENEKNLYNQITDMLKENRINLIEKKSINQKKNKKFIKKVDEKEQTKVKKFNPIIVIKEDLPEFVGTDTKKYLLKKNDIISISPDICKILNKRDICKKIRS